MKINVSVDIDWIEEDGSIDDRVKEELISGVKAAISTKCLAKVEEKASKQIDSAINEAVQNAKASLEAKAIQFADDWLENHVVITDKWGDEVKRSTIMDLIKDSFDNTMEKHVDADGKFIASGHSRSGGRLIDWLTGKKVESVVSEKLKTLSKDIDSQITKYVNAGIRENVSNKFAEMVVATAKADNALRLESESH